MSIDDSPQHRGDEFKDTHTNQEATQDSCGPMDEAETGSELDHRYIEAVSQMDEWLRRGETPFESDTAGSDEVRAAFEALKILERVHPRSLTGGNAAAANLGSIDRFELLSVLGKGGFGVVYLAYDPKLKRRVALKIPRLHAIGDDDQKDRLLAEAEAAGSLEHPNIVPVLDTGQVGPACYIASVYCEEGDLGNWINETGPADAKTAARIVAKLASAVDYSHRNGILHRDIKPSNVLLAALNTGGTETDELPFVPRLSDFGLSRRLQQETGTTDSVLLGSPHYMAPEQTVRNGESAGTAADVYSLGVVLYELLTGVPPFPGTDFLEVVERVRKADPFPPSRLARSVPRDLETICLKCLKKGPTQRYESADRLLVDLQAFLDGRPISARQGAVLENAAKWFHRRPLLALLISVLICAGSGLIWMQREHRQKLKAVEVSLRSVQRQTESQDAEAQLRNGVDAIHSASLNINQGNFALAGKLLEPFRDFMNKSNSPLQQFAFEWNYVIRQIDGPQPVFTFQQHKGRVECVAVSSDGRRVASGDEGGRIKIWDLLTGDEIASLDAHEGEVRAVEFSPDGRYLASGGQFHLLKIWSTSDWSLLRSVDAHDGTIMCLSWQPEDRFLASGGRDGKVRIWQGSDLTKIDELDAGRVVYCVRSQSNRADVWTADKANHISRWSASEGIKPTWTRVDIYKDPSEYQALDVLLNGKLAVVCTGFLNVTGQQLRLSNHTYGQRGAVISAQGRWAVVNGRNGNAKLWRWIDDPFQGVSEWGWPAHPGSELTACAASLDGTLLITAANDGSVKVWRMSEFKRPAQRWFLGASSICRSLAFSPDERLLAMSSFDGWIRVYESETGRLIESLKAGVKCEEVAFGADSKTLFACVQRPGTGPGGGHGLVIWEPGSSQQEKFVLMESFGGMSMTPDGTRMAYATRPDQYRIEVPAVWDTVRQEVIRTFPDRPKDCSFLRISPDGRKIAVGSDSHIALLEVDTGFPLWSRPFRKGAVAEFDRTGQRLIVSEDNRPFVMVDVNNGLTLSQVHDFKHVTLGNAWKSGFDLSPVGSKLAVSSVIGNPLGDGQAIGYTDVYSVDLDRPVLSLVSFRFKGKITRYSRTGRYLAVAGTSGDDISGVVLREFDLPRINDSQNEEP